MFLLDIIKNSQKLKNNTFSRSRNAENQPINEKIILLNWNWSQLKIEWRFDWQCHLIKNSCHGSKFAKLLINKQKLL